MTKKIILSDTLRQITSKGIVVKANGGGSK